jgi:iron complex transport system ATP-binding protein
MRADAPGAAPCAPALQARGVGYRIGGAAILQDVDLDVRAGEILAVAGPNGAGKSTLLGILAGDLAPTSGTVTLGGRALGGIGVAELARLRAVMLQEAHLAFAFSVADVVRMGRAALGAGAAGADEEAVAEALAATDALHLAARRFPSLSGGEKARVGFARALAQEAAILLLDEPTAALDIRHQELVMGLARREADLGRAVVAVLHDLSLAAAWADRLALLGSGRLVAVGPVEEVATAAALSELYEHPVAVMSDPATGLPVVMPRRGELALA